MNKKTFDKYYKPKNNTNNMSIFSFNFILNFLFIQKIYIEIIFKIYEQVCL